MSKEAKVGLLLGLALIVGIVLVLRGLHGNEEAKLEDELSISNQLINRSDSLEEDSVDIPTAVVQLSHRETPIPAVDENNPDIRYVGDLPGGFSSDPEPTGGLVIPPAEDPILKLKSITEPIKEDKSLVKLDLDISKSVESPQDRIYIVGNRENLTKISQRVYGKVEGSKYKHIKGIYEANKDKMPSMDVVHPGQKLVIPRLPGEPGALKWVVKNQTTGQESRDAKQGSGQEYLVRKHDSLWDIAEEKLGSGLRYKEIKELNGLKSDAINEGQKLRLPSR